MNTTKKSLTTLAAAAVFAGGMGLAIAQTYGSASTDTSVQSSDTTLNNTQSSGAGSATLGSSTDTSSSTTMSNTETFTQERIAQADRN
jgi:hypothetical protein